MMYVDYGYLGNHIVIENRFNEVEKCLNGQNLCFQYSRGMLYIIFNVHILRHIYILLILIFVNFLEI